MDLFDIKYNNPEDGDLYAISIVDSPANGMQFITLSEQAKKIQLADKMKQILTGVVLVPEQLIYREFEDGTPFNIKFSEETILNLSQDFLRKGYQLNATYNHIGSYLDGICVVEQWIIEDPMNDKSNALGFEGLPKGTWMVSMKLSDELWSQYIETGKAKGFSIDSFLDLQKVSMSIINNNKKINKKEKMSLLKKLIKMFSEENVNLATITIDGMGDLTADAFEVGNIVYVDVEGAMQPLMSQSFEYDGFTYTTDDTGAIVTKEAVATVDPNISVTMMDVTLPEGVVSAPTFAIGETLLLDGLPYINADIEVEGLHVVSDDAAVIITSEPVAPTVDPNATVAMDSEELDSFEVDGVSYYAEDLELGCVVYDETKAMVPNFTFENEGVVYVTDANGEIISTTKNPDSPFWAVEMNLKAEVTMLKQTVTNLQEQLEIITKQKETITSENVAMKEQLSTIPNATKLKAQLSSQAPKQVSEMDTLRAILAKA